MNLTLRKKDFDCYDGRRQYRQQITFCFYLLGGAQPFIPQNLYSFLTWGSQAIMFIRGRVHNLNYHILRNQFLENFNPPPPSVISFTQLFILCQNYTSVIIRKHPPPPPQLIT